VNANLHSLLFGQSGKHGVRSKAACVKGLYQKPPK